MRRLVEPVSVSGGLCGLPSNGWLLAWVRPGALWLLWGGAAGGGLVGRGSGGGSGACAFRSRRFPFPCFRRRRSALSVPMLPSPLYHLCYRRPYMGLKPKVAAFVDGGWQLVGGWPSLLVVGSWLTLAFVVGGWQLLDTGGSCLAVA